MSVALESARTWMTAAEPFPDQILQRGVFRCRLRVHALEIRVLRFEFPAALELWLQSMAFLRVFANRPSRCV